MEQIINRMPRGQYPSINNEDIQNISINCPSLSVQDKVIQEIEEKEFQMNRLRSSLNEQDDKISIILEKTLKLKAIGK